MLTYKVTLNVPVTVTATCEIEVSAKTSDQAHDIAIERYKELDVEHQVNVKMYRMGKSSKYPPAPFTWTIDPDDILNELDEDDIEIDEVKEV